MVNIDETFRPCWNSVVFQVTLKYFGCNPLISGNHRVEAHQYQFGLRMTSRNGVLSQLDLLRRFERRFQRDEWSREQNFAFRITKFFGLRSKRETQSD